MVIMRDRALEKFIEEQTKKGEFSPGQHWILKPMEVMDFYPYSGGVCNGFSHTAADMFVKGQLFAFYRIAAEINQSNQSLSDDVKNTIDKRNQFVREQYALFKEKMDTKSLTLSGASLEEMHLTEHERDILQIKPYLNSIYIHQYTQFQADLFENKSSPFTLHHDMAKFGVSEAVSEKHIANIGSMLSIYSPETLTQSLFLLRILFDHTPNRLVSFVLCTPDHAIFVGYNPSCRYWHFIDINKMPGEIIAASDLGKLVANIFTAFSSAYSVLLSSQFYMLNDHELEVDCIRSAISHLQQTAAWNAVQITALDKDKLADVAKFG
jgi:hypothetical protein